MAMHAKLSVLSTIQDCRYVASTLEVIRPYCVVITATPTFAYSLDRIPHKCGTAIVVPAL